MAENLAIPGRMSVRSPMQWSRGANGGFSTAPKEALCRPLVADRRWGPAGVNVADQERDGGSLLTWMEQLVRRRRAMPEIAFGAWAVLPLPEAAVLGLCYDWEERTVVILHNLGAEPCVVSPRLQCPSGAAWARLVDLFGAEDVVVGKDGACTVELPAHGQRWFRAERGDA